MDQREKNPGQAKKKNPAEGMDVCFLSVVCCQVQISATGSSHVERSPTEYGVSECDREASIMGRPWPTRGCRAMEKYAQAKLFLNIHGFD
jgi:hypothetical protein